MREKNRAFGCRLHLLFFYCMRIRSQEKVARPSFPDLQFGFAVERLVEMLVASNNDGEERLRITIYTSSSSTSPQLRLLSPSSMMTMRDCSSASPAATAATATAPANPSDLTIVDLWHRSTRVADFISSHPSFSFPPLALPRPRPPPASTWR